MVGNDSLVGVLATGALGTFSRVGVSGAVLFRAGAFPG